jgi:amino acid permease
MTDQKSLPHSILPHGLDLIVNSKLEQNIDLRYPTLSIVDEDTPCSSIFNAIVLASSSIGISALAYPSSMANTGIILWFFLLALAIAVNYISSYLLVLSGKELKVSSFNELCDRLIGRWRVFVDFFEFILNTGIMMCNMLTFNDFMTGIFNHDYFQGQPSKLVSSKKSLVWIVLPNLLVLPLLLRKRIQDTHFISIMSVCTIVMLAFFSVYMFLTKKNHITFHKLEYFNPSESASCFSLLLFGYMTQQDILDVYTKIRGRKVDGVQKVLRIQNVILTFVYVAIALFGYLTFYNHKDVKNNNIFAFDVEKNFAFVMLNLFVAMSVFFSNVVYFHPTMDNLGRNIEHWLPGSFYRSGWVLPLVLQVLLIVAASSLEILDLNFLNLIDFLSVFISPMICIYLPLYFYIKISKNYSFFLIMIFVMVLNGCAIAAL